VQGANTSKCVALRARHRICGFGDWPAINTFPRLVVVWTSRITKLTNYTCTCSYKPVLSIYVAIMSRTLMQWNERREHTYHAATHFDVFAPCTCFQCFKALIYAQVSQKKELGKNYLLCNCPNPVPDLVWIIGSFRGPILFLILVATSFYCYFLYFIV